MSPSHASKPNWLMPKKNALAYGPWKTCDMILGYTWVKIESTESHELAGLANGSSEPTKFLSCDSRSAHLTNERLAIWCPC